MKTFKLIAISFCILCISVNTFSQFNSSTILYNTTLQNTLSLKNKGDININFGTQLSNYKAKNVNLALAFNPKFAAKASFNYNTKNKNENSLSDFYTQNGMLSVGYYFFKQKKESENYKSGIGFNTFLNYSFYNIKKQFDNYYTGERLTRTAKIKAEKYAISGEIQFSTQKIFNVNYQFGLALLNYNKTEIPFEYNNNFFNVLNHINEHKNLPFAEQSIVLHFGGPFIRYFCSFSNNFPLYKSKTENINFRSLSTNNILGLGIILEIDKIIKQTKALKNEE